MISVVAGITATTLSATSVASSCLHTHKTDLSAEKKLELADILRSACLKLSVCCLWKIEHGSLKWAGVSGDAFQPNSWTEDFSRNIFCVAGWTPVKKKKKPTNKKLPGIELSNPYTSDEIHQVVSCFTQTGISKNWWTHKVIKSWERFLPYHYLREMSCSIVDSSR